MKNLDKITTGIDMVEIKRIEKSIEKNGFLEKYFTEAENLLFEKRKKTSVIAGNFAAKEAFSKVLGSGVRGFRLKDVEVLRDDLGAPYFNFYDSAKEIVEKNNLEFSLSITNTSQLATAMVVGYRKTDY